MKKVLMAFFFCLLFSVSVQAKDVLPTDTTTAGTGCTLVGLEGSYITQAQEALDRINEIRKEACEEGIRDPRDESRNLTPDDYKEIKWSSDLEYIARIRAAEATMVIAHQRPNGKSCFSLKAPSGKQSGGEVLAWAYVKTMVKGIESWYTEKDAWVGNTGKETGHYTKMIDPSNTYVGLGAFYNSDAVYPDAIAGEFSGARSLDETKNTMEGECIQTIEVKNSNLSFTASVENTD